MPAEKKLSRAQLAMMSSISDHGDPLAHIRGQSEHGGAVSTRVVLVREKIIEWVDTTKKRHGHWQLTGKGRRLLRAHRRGRNR